MFFGVCFIGLCQLAGQWLRTVLKTFYWHNMLPFFNCNVI